MRDLLAAGSADGALKDAVRSGFPFISHPMERGASRCRIPRSRRQGSVARPS